MPNRAPIAVIGGGLAGPEAAYQIARRGLRHGLEVELYEMRPRVSTPAHRTSALGELVCSNSLKSETPNTAPWLLKQELRHAGCGLLAAADATAVPGGQSLTVDRERFSAAIEDLLASLPNLRIRRQEVTSIPSDRIVVLASGPLTSSPLAEDLARLTGRSSLYFYDAISPIVEADSIDSDRVYAASRYGKGGDDYLNCPLTRPEYERFHAALTAAESYPLREFEQAKFFEACLPLEELARRGFETLRFGPMKPVGLPDPRTGRLPYAAVQLRRENQRADSYNLVGFQNHLRFAAQAEVLRLIPGLEHARFLRFGQVHRNSYLLAPAVLSETLELRARPGAFVAGQLCGTEGYVEAIATGFLAGVFAAAKALGQWRQLGGPLNARGRTLPEIEARTPSDQRERPGQKVASHPVPPPPRATALGSLLHYMQHASPTDYAPANITFDLLPPLDVPERVRETRRQRQCALALEALDHWLERAGEPLPAAARS